MKISLRIENYYELYDTVINDLTDIEVPDFPRNGTAQELDDWWEDNIYPLCGVGGLDGFPAEGYVDGNSSYFVTVTNSDDPALVGEMKEWGL